MLVSRLLLVLRARWRLGLGVAVLVFGIVAGITALVPRSYTASAAVVLDVKSPDPVAGLVLPGMAVSGYMATQADILASERVALKAIERLSAESLARFRTQWQAESDPSDDFPAWLAARLLTLVDAKPGRDSNVMTVTSTARDPRLAAELANAFVRGFIETTLELKVEPARQYSGFFDQQAKVLREALEAAQARLSAYQRESGITAGDERVDVENARLAELARALVDLQGQASDSRSRVQQAGNHPDRMQEVLRSELVSGLSAELARQRARLDEVLARLGDNHPQVQEQRAGIAQLEGRIRQETARMVGSIEVGDAVNRSRLSQAAAAVDQQRARVITLRDQRERLAALAKDVENAQRAYDGIYSRQNIANVESQLTQTNVSVLKQASAPSQPSQPRLLLNLALGAALGLLAGLAACLLREGLRPVLRTADDLQAVADLPLLERVPALTGATKPRPPQRLRRPAAPWHPLDGAAARH